MNIFKAIGYVLLALIIGVIGMCIAPFYLLTGGRKTAKPNEPVVPDVPQTPDGLLAPLPTTVDAMEREFKPIESVSDALLQVADFHVTVKFSDSFAATVSVHKSQKLVKRKMRAISTASATLLKSIWLKDSWDMGDIALNHETSFERALLQTEEEGIKMIRAILEVREPQYLSDLDMFRDRYKTGMPMPPVPAVFDAKATNLALAVLRADSAAPQAVTGIQFTESPEQVNAVAKSTDRRKSEEIIEGTVTSAELRNMTFGAGAKPAPVFEVTIQSADGELHSKRGIRLQELFVQHEVKVGDHIRVECLGKTKVDSQGSAPGQRPTTRNEFRLEKLSSVGA